MGKSETDEAAKISRKKHQYQLLVATGEAAKIARKQHRHQLLEVAPCEQICLSCWMPNFSPWIADDQKLDIHIILHTFTGVKDFSQIKKSY